jgi:hypothetical protein
MNPYQSPFRPISPDMVATAPIPAQQPWEEPNEYRWFMSNDPQYTHIAAPNQGLINQLLATTQKGSRHSRIILDGMARGANTVRSREAAKRKARRGVTGNHHALRSIGMMEPITVGCPSDSRVMVVDANGKILADTPLTWSEYQSATNCANNGCKFCKNWLAGIHAGAKGREIIDRNYDAKQALKPTLPR